MVALCGPSGSGKSTLLNIAGLTLAPSVGDLYLGSTRVDFDNEAACTAMRRVRIGFVFQNFNLLPYLSAEENVAISLLMNGVPWSKARKEAASVLTQVGLGHRLGHRSHNLSGGEMQRVAVARALVHAPALILADEPTGNLDSAAGEAVLDLLRAAANGGTAVLMATHSERAAQRCDRVLRLNDGALVTGDPLSGSPQVGEQTVQ
jgi:putative ABC transport system ATP-binding protein